MDASRRSIWRLIVDWSLPSSRAAREMLPQLATLAKHSRSSEFMMVAVNQTAQKNARMLLLIYKLTTLSAVLTEGVNNLSLYWIQAIEWTKFGTKMNVHFGNALYALVASLQSQYFEPLFSVRFRTDR